MSLATRLVLPLSLVAAAATAHAQPYPVDVVWSQPAGGAVHSVAFSPDGERVAAGATAESVHLGRVSLWAADDGAPAGASGTGPDGPVGPARAVAFAPDGLALVSGHGAPCSPGCAASGLAAWSLPALGPLAVPDGPTGAVTAVAFGPADGPLAVATADGAVRLLDPGTRAVRTVLAGHAGGARGVAVSPNGARVASVGADGMLRVWVAATGAPLYAVAHPTTETVGDPISVAFSADGALLATGNVGYGATVRVWAAADGALVRTFDVGADAYGFLTVASVAFSPNGRYLLTGFSKETLYSTGETVWSAGLWFWDLVIGDHAALYEDTSAPQSSGAPAVALSATRDHEFAYTVGAEVRMGRTPLSLSVLIADEGDFTLVENTLPQGDHYGSVAPADIDGDGDLDLLVVRGDGRFPDTLHPELYRNDGADGGPFVFTEVPLPAPSYPGRFEDGASHGETLSWADADNDGDVDALVATAYGTGLYRNDGGTFADSGIPLPAYEEWGTFGTVEPRSSAWGDVDNDGDLDLVLPATGPGGPWPFAVLYDNDAGTLVPADTLATLFRDAQVVWGDVENDGDLDFLYLSPAATCETQGVGGECLVVYENTAGVLTPLPYDFPDIEGGTADFGDFDLDGDLDVLLVATLSSPTGPPYLLDRAIVYRNDGATFAPDTLDFPFSFDETFQTLNGGQWADFDSDGDVDIVISADVNDYGGPNPDFGGVAFVFANAGGAFTLAATIPASKRSGTATWADLDGDGDLDFVTTGSRVEDGAWVDFARVYRNDAPGANAAPSAPAGLAATATADGVALSWAPAADDHTPSAALTYNLHVRAADGSDIVSPMSRPAGGRMVPEPGNVSLNTAWALSGLAPGAYSWSVQAVDNAYNGGAFADGGAFTVGPVGAEEAPAVAALALGVAPNPSSGPTAVTVASSGPTVARVEVVDALGRVVAVLHDGPLGAGAHGFQLDGARLPAGVYVVRATGDGASASRALTVVR